MYPYSGSTTLAGADDTPLEKKRGGCLTAWLGVSLAIALIGVVILFELLDLLRPGSMRPGVDRSWVITFTIAYGVLMLGHIASLYGIWNWKRWGVYGIAIIAFAAPVLELLTGTITTRDCVQPFLQMGLLAFLIRNKWAFFE